MTELYLKILSGNHIGAEIPLEPGRYSLGRDENCDLVLTDASINDIELILEISDSGQLSIQTSTADEPLYVNGAAAGSSIQCNHFDVISSSGLFFALGPVNTQWPEMTLPELQTGKKEIEATDATPSDTNQENPAPDSASNSDNIDNNDLTDIINSLEDEDEEGEDDDEWYEDDEEYEEEYENPLAQINKKLLIGIPAALISVLLTFLLVAGMPKPPPPPEMSTIEIAKEVRLELRLKDVLFKEIEGQPLLVSGYVPDSSNKRTLHKQLRAKGISFTSQVVAMNELRSNADELLKSRGYGDLLVELDNTPGSLVLTGYIGSPDEMDNLVSLMKQEVHGLVAIVDQVENQTSRVNILRSLLRERRLNTRVHLSVRPGKVTVRGHLLDDTQSYTLQELIRRFKDRYGNNPQITLATRFDGEPPSQGTSKKTKTTSGGLILPSLAIKGISMGKVPYVVMKDGSKYLIGAKLANGYIIEDINLEYLLLTNGTDRIKYRLGGNRGGH